MPVRSCRKDGKPGYKAGEGDQFVCYTYTSGNEDSRKRAKQKAEDQLQAYKANEGVNNVKDEFIEIPIQEQYTASEAEVDIKEGSEGEDPYAIITIIKSGVSKNKFRYSKERIQELQNVIEVSGRRKFYVNHIRDEKNLKTIGRDWNDWGATLKETWFEDNGGHAKLKGKIEFLGAPQGKKILEAAKYQPDELQFSINAYAGIEEVEESNGDSVKDVKKWYGYKSTDIVGLASAGGETEMLRESLEDQDLSLIYEAEKSFKEYLDKEIEQTKVFAALRLFRSLLIDISHFREYESSEEKKQAISELVGSFIEELTSMDIENAFESVDDDLSEEEKIKLYDQMKEVADTQFNMSLPESYNNDKEELMETLKTVEDFKKEYPDLAESFESKVEEKVKKALEEEKETDEELDSLKENLSEKDTEIKEKEKEISSLKEKLDNKENELADYKEKEAQQEREEFVRESIDSSTILSKVGFDNLPERTQKNLLSIEEEEEVKEELGALEEIYKETVEKKRPKFSGTRRASKANGKSEVSVDEMDASYLTS